MIPTELSRRCERDCYRWLEGLGSRCSLEFCVALYYEQNAAPQEPTVGAAEKPCHPPAVAAPLRWDPNKSALVPRDWSEMQGMKKL